MKTSNLLILAAWIAMTCGCSRTDRAVESITPFKVTIAANFGDQLLTFDTLFVEQFAIEGDPGKEGQVDAVYDLTAMSWRDFELSKTVTLKDAEAWAQESSDVTRKSLEKTTDPQVKKFAAATLEPNLIATKEEGALVLQNEIVTYRLTGSLPLDRIQRKRVLDYDRLNAYRKGLVLKKQHPATQLAVDEELAKLDFFPSQWDVDIRPADKVVKVRYTFTVNDLTPAELEWARAAIQRNP